MTILRMKISSDWMNPARKGHAPRLEFKESRVGFHVLAFLSSPSECGDRAIEPGPEIDHILESPSRQEKRVAALSRSRALPLLACARFFRLGGRRDRRLAG